MATEPGRIHHRHVELAQRILDFASERGMSPGERLAEQALASHCNVSRTPVRKALQVLAERELVTADARWRLSARRRSGGHRTARRRRRKAMEKQRSTAPSCATSPPAASPRRRRLPACSDAMTSPARRYKTRYKKLSEDNLAERGAGQQWLLKQFALGSDAVAKSYEFRLATEPLATDPARIPSRPAGADLAQAVHAHPQKHERGGFRPQTVRAHRFRLPHAGGAWLRQSLHGGSPDQPPSPAPRQCRGGPREHLPADAVPTSSTSRFSNRLSAARWSLPPI